jgi:hypothetical protein
MRKARQRFRLAMKPDHLDLLIRTNHLISLRFHVAFSDRTLVTTKKRRLKAPHMRRGRRPFMVRPKSNPLSLPLSPSLESGENLPASLMPLPAHIADPRGLALVLEICETGHQDRSGHILVPDGKTKLLAPEDLDYLRLKGAFSLPEKYVCDQLIRTYFHYVHPFCPIIEAKSFLPAYEKGETDKFGIHLLWCMFLVASHVSFLTPDAPSGE